MVSMNGPAAESRDSSFQDNIISRNRYGQNHWLTFHETTLVQCIRVYIDLQPLP